MPEQANYVTLNNTLHQEFCKDFRCDISVVETNCGGTSISMGCFRSDYSSIGVVFFHDFPRTTEFVSVTNTTGQRFFTKG